MSKVIKSMRRDVGKNVALNTRKRLKGGEKKLPERRNFMRFDSTARSHIRLSEPLTLIGDFEISFKSQAFFGEPFVFVGGDDSDNNRISLTDDGRVAAKLNGSYAVIGSIAHAIHSRHLKHFRIVRLANTVYVYVDGFLATKETNNGIPTFTRIGDDAGITIGHEGVLSDFNVWVGGDRFSGTHTIDMPLDDKDNSSVCWNQKYQQNDDVLPSFGFPYSESDLNTLIISAGSTSFSIDEDGAIKVRRENTDSSWLIRRQMGFSAGAYIAEIHYEFTSPWSQQRMHGYAYSHRDSKALTSMIKSDNGVIRIVFESDADGHGISVVGFTSTDPADIGKEIRVKQFSIRPLSQILGVKVNFVESDVPKYTLNEQSEWVGANIIENGYFTNGSTGWTMADGWSVVDGYAQRDGDPVNDGIEQPDVFREGSYYDVQYETLNRTAGHVLTYIGQGTQRIDKTYNSDRDMYHSYRLLSNYSAKLLINGTNGFDGGVDNVSVKEVVPVNSLPKSRNLRKFDSTAQSRANLGVQTISGDFEVELRFVIYDKTGHNHLFGGGLFGFRVDSTGQGGRARVLLPKTGGSAYYRPIDTSETIVVGRVYTVGLRRNGTKFTSSLNGATDDFSFPDVVDELPISYIGTGSVGAWQTDGIIFDLKVWTGGDRESGNLYLDMPIDDPFGLRLIENKAAALTDVTVPPSAIAFADDGSFTDNGDDSFTVSDVTNSSFGPTWDAGISESKSYIMEFEVTELVGILYIQRWTESWDATTLGNDAIYKAGKYRVPVVDCGKLSMRLRSGESDHRFTVKNLRIYESDKPQAFAENNVMSDVVPFSFSEQFGFLGPELVTQGVWKTPNIVHESGWLFNESSNTWVLSGNGGYEQLKLFDSTEYPNQYLLSFVVEGLSGPFAYLEQNGFVVDDGYYTFLVGPDDAGQTFKRNSGIVNATLHKPSLREILEFK